MAPTVAVVCDYDQCAVNHVDLDGDRTNGCEYDCPWDVLHHTTDEGGEFCGVDDDCDGTIDEDVDLCGTDDCGSCGTTCADRPHQVGSCTVMANTACDSVETHCTYGGCENGWADQDGDPLNGCEMHPGVPAESGLEVCDGWDNDGDGLVDESGSQPDGIDGTGDPIGTAGYIGHLCGKDVGICTTGIVACVGGAVKCQGATEPRTEICDGLDNDCNGRIDDGDLCGGGVCQATFDGAACTNACTTNADCPGRLICRQISPSGGTLDSKMGCGFPGRD